MPKKLIATNEDDPHSRYGGELLTESGYKVSTSKTAVRDSIAIFGTSGDMGKSLLIAQMPGEQVFADRGIEVPQWALSAGWLIAIGQTSVSELKGSFEDDLRQQLAQLAERYSAASFEHIPE